MAELDALVDVLRSLLAALAIGGAALGLGRPLYRWLAPQDTDRLSTGVWSVVLGMLVAGGELYALSRVGWLGEPAIYVLTATGLLMLGVESACYLAVAEPRAAQLAIKQVRDAARDLSPLAGGAMLIAGSTLACALILALTPPTDAEVVGRSLGMAKNWLALGGHPGSGTPLPAPSLSQYWWIWAMALDGPVAANLVQWMLGTLLAAATVMLARSYVDRHWAWGAGLLLLTSPWMLRQLPLPLEGISLALVTTLSISAVSRRSVFSTTRYWLTQTALLAGAVAADPVAGVLAGVVAVGYHQLRWGTPLGVATTALAAMFAVYLALGAPATAGTAPIRPWQTLFLSGPAILICAMGLAFARNREGLVVCLGALAIAVMLGNMAGGGQFLLLPAASAAAALGAAQLVRFPSTPRAVVAALTLLVGLASVGGPLRAAAARLPVAAGWQSRAAYLTAREGSFRAAVVFNQIRKPRDRILSEDVRDLYFAGATGVWNRPTSGGSREAAAAVSQLLARARGEGYAFVLLAEPETAAASPAASRAGAAPEHFHEPENFASAQEVIPILEYRFADDNHRSVRYRLWKLQGPGAAPQRTSTADVREAGIDVPPRPLAR